MNNKKIKIKQSFWLLKELKTKGLVNKQNLNKNSFKKI